MCDYIIPSLIGLGPRFGAGRFASNNPNFPRTLLRKTTEEEKKQEKNTVRNKKEKTAFGRGFRLHFAKVAAPRIPYSCHVSIKWAVVSPHPPLLRLSRMAGKQNKASRVSPPRCWGGTQVGMVVG